MMQCTAVAAPALFRPGNPALCGSRPLVTPYNCRLGDLLCMLYLSTILCVYACVICVFFVFEFFLYSFLLQYFDTVGWVFQTDCSDDLSYHIYTLSLSGKICLDGLENWGNLFSKICKHPGCIFCQGFELSALRSAVVFCHVFCI